MLLISYVPVVPVWARCHLLLNKVFLTASTFICQRYDRPLDVDVVTPEKIPQKTRINVYNFFRNLCHSLFLFPIFYDNIFVTMADCHLLKLVYCFVETFFNSQSPFILRSWRRYCLAESADCGGRKHFTHSYFYLILLRSFGTYFSIMKFEIKCRPCFYDLQTQSSRGVL